MIAVARRIPGAEMLSDFIKKLDGKNDAPLPPGSTPRPAKRSLQTLDSGYKREAQAQGIESPLDFELALNNPQAAETGINRNTGNPYIKINPEDDEVLLAHELGHLVSKQTPVGNIINQLRHQPALTKALAVSALGLPVVTSAMEEGDDDLDTALLGALVASAPTIIDESAASINAYNLMNKAGARGMDGRQARRLAGGYLSYLALPMLAGVTGNVIGNQFD